MRQPIETAVIAIVSSFLVLWFGKGLILGGVAVDSPTPLVSPPSPSGPPAKPSNQPSRSVTAERVEIVRGDGRVVAVLTASGDGKPVAIVTDGEKTYSIDLAKVARLAR